MSNLLFIDTSGSLAAVAHAKEGEVTEIIYHNDSKTQAAVLNTLIEEVLLRSKTTLQDLDGICVCAGPGSYTGLRVGLSIAKGIAFSLNKKIMLFDKLILTAQSFRKSESNADKLIVLSARQDEFFMALFDAENQVKTVPQHILLPDLLSLSKKLNKDTILITDQENLPLDLNTISIDNSFKIDFESWLQLAEKRRRAYDWDDLAYSEPLYLKAAFTTKQKNKSSINP